MDGRGRWFLKAYANGLKARIGIDQWFRFYNRASEHPSI
jgi:hypothetical protein